MKNSFTKPAEAMLILLWLLGIFLIGITTSPWAALGVIMLLTVSEVRHNNEYHNE